MYPQPSDDIYDNRMSIVSGPKVRRYDTPVWDDEEDSCSRSSTMTDLSFKVKEAVKIKCGTRERAIAMPGSWKNYRLGTSPSITGSTTSFSNQLLSSTSGSSFASSLTSGSSSDSYSHLSSSSSSSSYPDTSHRGTPSLRSEKSFDTTRERESSASSRKQQTPKLLDAFDDTPTRSQKTPSSVVSYFQGMPESPSGGKSTYNTPSSNSRHVKRHPMPEEAFPLATTTPSFALISLAEAQDRERIKNGTNTNTQPNSSSVGTVPFPKPEDFDFPPSSARSNHNTQTTPRTRTPGSHHVKGKKSGIMRLISKTPRSPPPFLISSPVGIELPDTAEPKVASTKLNSVLQEQPSGVPVRPEKSIRRLMPQLELRPVSMKLTDFLTITSVPSLMMIYPTYHLLLPPTSSQHPL